MVSRGERPHVRPALSPDDDWPSRAGCWFLPPSVIVLGRMCAALGSRSARTPSWSSALAFSASTSPGKVTCLLNSPPPRLTQMPRALGGGDTRDTLERQHILVRGDL